MGNSVLIKQWQADPYNYSVVRELADELQVSDVLATVLARRGYRSAGEARAFLDDAEFHDPFGLHGMSEAVETVRAAVDSEKQITVYGDYDVDGVCSVAVTVAGLRELGAKVKWFIPSRFEEGYGLAVEAVEKLAAEGTEVLIAVDCGITSVEEVDQARRLGVEVVVLDHHTLAEALPQCTVVHPKLNDYPCSDLCATAICSKFTQAIYSASGRDPNTAGQLDLVALATVADVVPLIGENRALVREGLKALANTERAGLKALAEVAKVDLAAADTHDISFRLAPRINAAGRIYRADAGVELLLTDDVDRARDIARELDSINRERQMIERSILVDAEKQATALFKADSHLPALVLSGEGWHPGVIGIVASRMVQRYSRPCVVISLPHDGSGDDAVATGGQGRGSGRSVEGYDLLAGLGAAAEHLNRFGGHKMAAGLEVEPHQVDSFRESFVGHARELLGGQELVPTERVDALVSADALGLDLAEELERLAPFGAGNPAVSLMIPGAKISGLEAMGDGSHARFSITSGAARAEAVAFRCGGKLPVNGDGGHDLSFKLEVNRWNGTIEPRLILRSIHPPVALNGARGVQISPSTAQGEAFWPAVLAEIERDLKQATQSPQQAGRRTLIDRRGKGAIGQIAELLSSGEKTAILCADTARRRELIENSLNPSKFGAETHVFSKLRPSELSIESTVSTNNAVAFVDYEVASSQLDLLDSFQHVTMLDPPASNLQAAAALGGSAAGPGDGAYAHMIWAEAEVEFTEKVLQYEYGLKAPLKALYRGLSKLQGGQTDEELIRALVGDGAQPRSPGVVGRCLRVLCELDLVRLDYEQAGVKSLTVERPASKVELEQSQAFRVYCNWHQEGVKFLQRALIPKFL